MPDRVYDLLIVDDKPGMRCLLYEMFIDEGYRVDTASSGFDAIRKAAGRTFLLILLDVKMPGMNGLETLEELRKIAPETPVVMMTACDEMKLIARAKKKGVRHFIVKPFDLDEARCLVNELLLEEKARRN